MNDEQATGTESAVEPHGERDCRSDAASSESPEESSTELGITDEDMEQIRSFIEKQRFCRSVDDLQPSSD